MTLAFTVSRKQQENATDIREWSHRWECMPVTWCILRRIESSPIEALNIWISFSRSKQTTAKHSLHPPQVTQPMPQTAFEEAALASCKVHSHCCEHCRRCKALPIAAHPHVKKEDTLLLVCRPHIQLCRLPGWIYNSSIYTFKMAHSDASDTSPKVSISVLSLLH